MLKYNFSSLAKALFIYLHLVEGLVKATKSVAWPWGDGGTSPLPQEILTIDLVLYFFLTRRGDEYPQHNLMLRPG